MCGPTLPSFLLLVHKFPYSIWVNTVSANVDGPKPPHVTVAKVFARCRSGDWQHCRYDASHSLKLCTSLEAIGEVGQEKWLKLSFAMLYDTWVEYPAIRLVNTKGQAHSKNIIISRQIPHKALPRFSLSWIYMVGCLHEVPQHKFWIKKAPPKKSFRWRRKWFFQLRIRHYMTYCSVGSLG